MIEQQELQRILSLPVADRLRLAQKLIESALTETNDNHPDQGLAESEREISPAARWLLDIAGCISAPPDTSARADEILIQEVDRYSGFTTKTPLNGG